MTNGILTYEVYEVDGRQGWAQRLSLRAPLVHPRAHRAFHVCATALGLTRTFLIFFGFEKDIFGFGRVLFRRSDTDPSYESTFLVRAEDCVAIAMRFGI